MRKKNVLIAIFFITILLLVPFNSVTGSIDNKPIKANEEQENLSSIPYGFSFGGLRAIVNIINLLFRNYPEVTEICNNITKILDARIYPILCVLFAIIYGLEVLLFYRVEDILDDLGLVIFIFLLTYTEEIANYFCGDFSSKVNTDLSLINLKNIKNTIHCPCIQ
jgi:hypothetical protein